MFIILSICVNLVKEDNQIFYSWESYFAESQCGVDVTLPRVNCETQKS